MIVENTTSGETELILVKVLIFGVEDPDVVLCSSEPFANCADPEEFTPLTNQVYELTQQDLVAGEAQTWSLPSDIWTGSASEATLEVEPPDWALYFSFDLDTKELLFSGSLKPSGTGNYTLTLEDD